jgi:hypothetical protein
MTLLYLGEMDKLGDIDVSTVVDLLKEFGEFHAPVEGVYNGIGEFVANDGVKPVVLLYDSPYLPYMRTVLHSFMRSKLPELDLSQNHGFTPHSTMAYIKDDTTMGGLDITVDYPKTFDTIWLYWGGKHYSVKFTGNYREKQLPIGEAAKKALISVRISIFQNEITTLTEKMYIGDVTIGGYEETMRAMIRELHSAVASIAKGGWDNMTQSDWGKIGAPVKRQYRYLHGFMQDISDNRENIPLGTIQRRARMYGDAAGSMTNEMQAGDIRPYLPWIPRDGSTDCLMSCKCSWTKINDKLSKDDKTRTITYRWDLHPAEHCITCIDRDGYKSTFTVPASIQAPQSIGGL